MHSHTHVCVVMFVRRNCLSRLVRDLAEDDQRKMITENCVGDTMTRIEIVTNDSHVMSRHVRV